MRTLYTLVGTLIIFTVFGCSDDEPAPDGRRGSAPDSEHSSTGDGDGTPSGGSKDGAAPDGPDGPDGMDGSGATPGTNPGTDADTSRPNLLVIMTDQHNFRTLGAYRALLSDEQANVWGPGNNVETPNIDALADEGMLFNKFYASSPVCSPSRGAFVSGRYPQQNGALQNSVPMDDGVITFAQVLQEAGYETGYAGKWHLDGSAKPQWSPTRTFGFSDTKYMFNRGHWKNLIETQDGPAVGSTDANGDPDYGLAGADETNYTTDFLTDRAIDFVTRNKDKPFALMLSIPDPHGPESVRAPYDTMYDDMQFEPPPTYDKSDVGVPSWAEKYPEALLDQSTYFGMVKCVDDNVGRLVAHLKAQGLYERTIIVYTADHGDMRAEHHRENKGSPLEAAAKVPFIVSYPDAVPAGSVVHTAVGSVDFAPSILSLMGQDIPASMQGTDVSGILKDPSTQGDAGDLIFARAAGDGGNKKWIAAMTGRYKLVLSNVDDPWLLDLQEDPNELINQIADPENQMLVRDLATNLRQYADDYADPHVLASPKLAADLDNLAAL